MIVASEEGNLDVVHELLAHGADIEASSNFGHTSLIEASLCGHVGVVHMLIEAGADKTRATNNGGTAASLAGMSNDPPGSLGDAIRALLAAAP